MAADALTAIAALSAPEDLLPMSAQTIHALATAPGRAGVAVLRISGAAARKIPAYLHTTLPEPRYARMASWRTADGMLIDRGLMLYFPAPHSFTGEDVLELHCHGSLAVIDALQRCLSTLPNVRPAEPGEFTRRAYLLGKMDALETEGLLDLIHAETDAQRLLALDHLSGRSSRQLHVYHRQGLQALAWLEACIDFSEEDIPAELDREVRDGVALLHDALLLELADSGPSQRIREGTRLVILGPPNAGKSTLLNLLAKHDKAIVSPIAGTTRDSIEIRISLQGRLLSVTDTAGLRETSDPLEAEGILRSRQQEMQADMRLVLLDATQEYSPDDWDCIQNLLPLDHRPIMVVINKIDQISAMEERWARHRPSAWQALETIRLSLHAPSSAGIIERWIGERMQTFSSVTPGAERLHLSHQRHRVALREAIAWYRKFLDEPLAMLEIRCEMLRMGLQCLDRITGKTLADDVLGQIFSQFCIGK